MRNSTRSTVSFLSASRLIALWPAIFVEFQQRNPETICKTTEEKRVKSIAVYQRIEIRVLYPFSFCSLHLSDFILSLRREATVWASNVTYISLSLSVSLWTFSFVLPVTCRLLLLMPMMAILSCSPVPRLWFEVAIIMEYFVWYLLIY